MEQGGRCCPTALSPLCPTGVRLLKYCAGKVIYWVSYGFVFPCVNIWEAQLMFCAQPRQLQHYWSTAAPLEPSMQISPLLPLHPVCREKFA